MGIYKWFSYYFLPVYEKLNAVGWQKCLLYFSITYKLQLDATDHWACAEREGGDARYNDEAVKQHSQVYVSSSWGSRENKITATEKAHCQIR